MGTSVSAAPTVIRTKNFVADAAAFILEQAHKAIAERNEFRIALSGGNTPTPVYARIAVEAHDFPWESVRFTFGDERCVPPDDPQSNFRMARENLFVPAAVPEKSIMRMRGGTACCRSARSVNRSAGVRRPTERHRHEAR